MKNLFNYVVLFIFCLVMSKVSFAQENYSARNFTMSWIENKQTKTYQDDIVKIVAAAFDQGAKHKIDPLLIIALINKESTFNKKARNKSKASGLMQVIPYWHKDKINGRNIFSVNVNIEVGTIILKDCLEKHRQKIQPALRCYSGGANNKYFKDVMSTRKKLQTWIIEQQFLSQEPLFYALVAKENHIY